MLRDDQFERGNVPMTKEEVRAVIMAKAAITEDSCVIDIGAGTGSLSIQAALVAKNGKVFALEYNPEAVDLIKKNCNIHQVKNVHIVQLWAPEGLKGLPRADAIILGGSGGRLEEIIKTADSLLLSEGRLVVASVTLSTLWNSVTYLTNLNYKLDICQVAVTKYVPVKSHLMAKAHNPIFVITAEKEDKL